jgi:predicted RNA-binding protein with PIN domain
MPVVIDGHNLLWSVQNNEDCGLVSDVQLCRVISEYLKQIGDKGELVFDGTGPSDKSGFENISNLEVTFSGLASDCDTVIEHKIRASSAPGRLTVVSSDRRLRDAAHARKATSVKSEDFWKDVQRQLRRRRRSDEPRGKRDGIDAGEAEQWMRFFGLEQ